MAKKYLGESGLTALVNKILAKITSIRQIQFKLCDTIDEYNALTKDDNTLYIIKAQSPITISSLNDE